MVRQRSTDQAEEQWIPVVGCHGRPRWNVECAPRVLQGADLQEVRIGRSRYLARMSCNDKANRNGGFPRHSFARVRAFGTKGASAQWKRELRTARSRAGGSIAGPFCCVISSARNQSRSFVRFSVIVVGEPRTSSHDQRPLSRKREE